MYDQDDSLLNSTVLLSMYVIVLIDVLVYLRIQKMITVLKEMVHFHQIVEL